VEFEAEGYRVMLAGSGEEALICWKTRVPTRHHGHPHGRHDGPSAMLDLEGDCTFWLS
jgi:hypothetical protein